jgi:hypothetical protein
MANLADDILVDDRFSKDNWWPTPRWARRELLCEFPDIEIEPERGVPFLVAKQRMPIPADATPIPIDWEHTIRMLRDIRRAVCGPPISRPDAEWSDDTP